MKQRNELSKVTFQEADAFYHHNIAGTAIYALVCFTDSYRMILTQEAALRLVQLLSNDTVLPAANPYTSPDALLMPTVRTLSEYEHRIHWLSDFFGCAYSDIENHTHYNPMAEHARAHRISYRPPSLDGLYIDDDLTETT